MPDLSGQGRTPVSVIILTMWLFLSNGTFVVTTVPAADQSDPQACLTQGDSMASGMLGKGFKLKDGSTATVEDAGYACAQVTKRPTV